MMFFTIGEKGREKSLPLFFNAYGADAATKSEGHKAFLQRQIEVTDAEIDWLVYDLYDLTEVEITIVEGEGKKSDQ